MAGKPQKNLAYSVLLDFYGPVLTDKQRVILTEYYDEDLSLAEIAENLGITRQGVRDAIKHGEAALDELEQKLGNARRHTRMQADLDRLAAARHRDSLLELRLLHAGPANHERHRGDAHDLTPLGHAGGCRWPLSL